MFPSLKYRINNQSEKKKGKKKEKLKNKEKPVKTVRSHKIGKKTLEAKLYDVRPGLR